MFDPNPALDALLRQLLHPQLKVIDPSLERIQRLMAALGNPQLDLPPVVHVAGTNGKGSLIAYLRAILKAAGYRVHAYISPHLVRFSERILLDDEEIAAERLTPLLEQVLALQTDYPATFFEATTAAAFLAFSQSTADIVLLETGMGGRLDATNLIPRPAVVAITPIGRDHAEFLGDTIAQIAAEKAGIIKAGCPVVIGPQVPEALAVLEAKAQTIGAPVFYPDSLDATLGLALQGEHQRQNAATALAVMRQLQGFTLTEENIREGLQAARWPARLQPLERGYWREHLPEGWKLYLDGGHNPHAAAAIAAWAETQDLPVTLIVGMLKNKDLIGYLAPWKGIATQIYGVAIPGEEKCYTAQEIAATAGGKVTPVDSVEAALELIKHEPVGLALICGSLYLAGHILARN